MFVCERESVYVCLRERQIMCVSIYKCVCVSERVRERESVCARERLLCQRSFQELFSQLVVNRHAVR